MADRVLVVTGGSRGIGAAVCMLAAEAGYAVVVNYADNVTAAEHVAAAIHKKGGEAIAVRGNVADEADVDHIFAAADRFGTLVGLVNNAGVVDVNIRVDELTPARLQRTFAINVFGTILCSGRAVKRMSTRYGGDGGAIVNLSSAAAKLGSPAVYVDYAAAKGAIDSFTIGLALEVAGEGIRVNAVRPGIIDTEIHGSGGDADRAHRIAPSIPIPRPGTAEEVAKAVLWLLSEDASYSTGAILNVTGGRALTP